MNNAATTARATFVTEGRGNTVHTAFWMETEDGLGRLIGTDCNREPFTTRYKRRTFYKSDHAVTCKRCIRIGA